MANYQLTDRDVAELREMRDWQRSFNGDNSVNTPSGSAFGQTRGRRMRQRIQQGATTAPQYTGMIYIGVGANTAGWAFLFTVDSLPGVS